MRATLDGTVLQDLGKPLCVLSAVQGPGYVFRKKTLVILGTRGLRVLRYVFIQGPVDFYMEMTTKYGRMCG